ncbi:MAG: CARDB domain-containing protein [Planctomycetota bacterium]|jgi:hypothetical protein
MNRPATCLSLLSAATLLSIGASAQVAEYHIFGSGCSGSVGVPGLSASGDNPALGKTFLVQLDNMPGSSLAVGVLGLSDQFWGATPLPLDLAIIGMPSCLLYTDFRRQYGINGAAGQAQWPVTMPSELYWIGQSFYQQAIVVDEAAGNALDLILTNAAEGIIGSGQDLIIASGVDSVIPFAPLPGGVVDLSAGVIRNDGIHAVGPFRYGQYVTSDPNAINFPGVLRLVDVPGLAAGAEWSIPAHSLQLPGGMREGVYYIRTVLDTEDAIAEANESNNAANAPFSIDVTGPDLTIHGAFYPGQSFAAGQQVIIAPRNLINLGNQAAGPFSEGIYLSLDANLTVADILLGGMVIPGIERGQFKPLSSIPVVIPGILPPGDYWLGSIIDNLGNVTELREDNNTASARISIR